MKMSDLMPKFLRASQPKEHQAMTFTAPVELKAGATDGDKPSRPTFAIKAYTGGPMNIEGFYLPVVVDLAGLRASRPKLPILLDHNPEKIVGMGVATISGTDVDIAGTVTGDSGASQEVVAHAKNGFEWQASIGATVERREILEAGRKAIVNGREFTGPLIIARQSSLNETSFVAMGADQNTSANVAATFSKGESEMEFETWLQASGFDPKALTDGQKQKLQATFAAEQKAKEIPPVVAPVATATPLQAASSPGTDAGVLALRAEAKRLADIERLCGTNAEIKAKAIDGNWDANRTELEVLRAGRDRAPAAVNISQEVPSEVLNAALCVAGGLKDVEKIFDDKTLQAAHTRFKGRLGLQQVLLEAAWQGGYDGRHFDGSQQGMTSLLKAAFSTLSLPGIFSNVSNKFLLESYNAVEDTWRQISTRRNVSDFKTVTSYRLTGGQTFEKVGPGGELKHGTLGEQSFTNKAETYGKMFSITRQDIINDDLGALTAVPRMIGRGAALELNLVFWTEFMNNASFFTSGNGNYQEGAGTVLAIDQLTAMELLFYNQTDPDGNPLAVSPAILLVPNALAVKATQFTKDLEVRDTTASTKYTTSNPHAGKWSVARSSYLSNSAITGYSTTAWYLLANPNDVSVIEVAFLNGQEQPIVETAEADFNTLGIQMRGYFDFGVSKQDYRGGCKSKGAA